MHRMNIISIVSISVNYTKYPSKKTWFRCSRLCSSNIPDNKIYSHTVLVPKTNFSPRVNCARRKELSKTAQFDNLYDWQREHLKGQEFVLHDGPPYANGDLHMGHSVNKILKDIQNRNHILQGDRVHYVPGWDCHGLPIELKALQRAKANSAEHSDPIQIRKLARDFALETVEKQKAAFKSWGVLGDWEKPYLTLDGNYVKKQLWNFNEMHKSGLIFRALKPVHWSPSSRTALAEAELEYDEKHKSKLAYVTFPIEEHPQIKDISLGQKVFALIWTTTPWSLVANRAICYGPHMKYSLVTVSDRPGVMYLVGSSTISSLEKILGVEMRRIAEFPGQHLEGMMYTNKLLNETLPFLPGDHVTEDKGTGLVHTAPAHGPDDFNVALKYNIAVECNVDETGCYSGLDPELNGLFVLKDGQDKVISRLGDSLVHSADFYHSYPLDWRTKQPIILRASQQWFIDTSALKEKAMDAVDNLNILPHMSAEKYRAGFHAQLQKRSWWCISRQRSWGVPIPAVYYGNEVIVDDRIVDKLCSLIDQRGLDAWWTCDVTDLLPRDLIAERNIDISKIIKGQDIMDIWLDSGLSWQTLPNKKAALYSEGIDQLTGWFQASLLTSLALRGVAPYESIFVHGFVVDGKKNKMSKSLGNVMNPATVIDGGQDKRKQPAYGVDTLRWWVASHGTQHSQIEISNNLLEGCQSEVLRIRKTFKFLLGSVFDLERDDLKRNLELRYLDRLMVQQCYQFLMDIQKYYNSFEYHRIVQTVLGFNKNKVSNIYCTFIKDRLYCSLRNSNERRSAQIVLNTILLSLCRALAPIVPHLIEEVWTHHPLYERPFYFTRELPCLEIEPVDLSVMETLLDLKTDIRGMTKTESLKKFVVNMKLETDVYNRLKSLSGSDLCEILGVSSVKMTETEDGDRHVRVEESEQSECLRCRNYNAMQNGSICSRCEIVLAALS